MKLRDLLDQDVQGNDAALEPAVAALDVSGVALDSRAVKPGDLFFALAGSKTDGVRFIDAAIAAGALAFETIESMFHGFGHGGSGWGGPGLGSFGERPVEVTNNNYYEEPGRGAEHGEHRGFNDGGYDPRNNDPGDNLRGFDNQNNAGNDPGSNAANDVSAFADQANFDDQSVLDDQNLDDGSSLDDSGSFDDGGGGFDDNGGGY